MKRVQILEIAADLVSGDRDKAYGDAFTNMMNLAELLTAYLEIQTKGRVIGVDGENLTGIYALTAVDAANIMVLVKMARTVSPSCGIDTFIDMAAYAAIAGECYEEQSND